MSCFFTIVNASERSLFSCIGDQLDRKMDDEEDDDDYKR